MYPADSGEFYTAVYTWPKPGTPGQNRERLAKTGKETAIWDEFQRQLEEQGLTIKRGVMQDASFITADPGHASADTPRGEQAPWIPADT